MHEIEIILGMLVVIAALAWLANQVRVPYPILLVLGGLGIALIPGLPQVTLTPHLVFILFLPPILYYAGTHTSWRDFKANIRPISMLAVGLVLFTTVAVAAAAKWMVPDISWAVAFTLGAIVSPPDAIAATAILQRLRVPRRVVTILEGESLVNDATALVTYRFAVAAAAMATAGEPFSLVSAGGWFAVVAVGGVAVGLAVGMLVSWIRPRMRDPMVENAVSLLTPWVAYLPAEWLHVSGVLAVVTCGIYISRRLGRITTAQVRIRAYAVWDTFIFILNGLVFILIGLQVSHVLRDAPAGSIGRGVVVALVVSVVAIVARMAWVIPTAYATRRFIPYLADRDPKPPFSAIFIVAWTQMRGVVSLAAALALPVGFPYRNGIIFITFGVILVTLVAQGLTLGAVIRAIGLDKIEDPGAADEEVTARYLVAIAAIERLDALGARDAAAAAALQRLRATYDDRVDYYSRMMNPDGNNPTLECETGENAARQSIAAQREMLLRLRDQGVIGDDVHRLVEQELDYEESRIEGEG